MKLEKTLAYLESQLKFCSDYEDVYQSWLSYPSGTLVDRCKEFELEITPDLVNLMESLEELQIHLAELKKELVERIADYDVRTYH